MTFALWFPACDKSIMTDHSGGMYAHRQCSIHHLGQGMREANPPFVMLSPHLAEIVCLGSPPKIKPKNIAFATTLVETNKGCMRRSQIARFTAHSEAQQVCRRVSPSALLFGDRH